MTGEDYANRIELLLDRFRKPGGERWRGFELERATGGRLSGSYVSQLKKGKIDNPGLRPLSLLADTVGFPLELWWKDHDHWDELLGESRAPNSCSRTTAIAVATPDRADWAILLPYRKLGEENRGVVVALAERLAALEAEEGTRGG